MSCSRCVCRGALSIVIYSVWWHLPAKWLRGASKLMQLLHFSWEGHQFIASRADLRPWRHRWPQIVSWEPPETFLETYPNQINSFRRDLKKWHVVEVETPILYCVLPANMVFFDKKQIHSVHMNILGWMILEHLITEIRKIWHVFFFCFYKMSMSTSWGRLHEFGGKGLLQDAPRQKCILGHSAPASIWKNRLFILY